MKAMLKSRNKMLSVFLALTLVLTLFAPLGGTALAATSDPNLVSYDTTTYPGYQAYTYNVAQSYAYAYLQVVPADVNYTPTYFSSASDADNVNWSIISDGELSSAVIFSQGNVQIATGQYLAYAEVLLTDPTEYGAATVRSANPVTGAKVDFTFAVDEDSPSYVSASNITVKVYEPNQANPNQGTFTTVNAGEYYAISHQHTYPTVLDALSVAQQNNVIDFYHTVDYMWLGDFVDEIDLNNNDYPNSGNYGWQYRVYRNSLVVPMSEDMGANAFKLLDGDVILWKYGLYNAPGLFPPTI